MNDIKAGDKVIFKASLSNGGVVRWTSTVVSVENDVAKVRHPQRARTFPFSPVQRPGLYLYRVASLVKGRVGVTDGTSTSERLS